MTHNPKIPPPSFKQKEHLESLLHSTISSLTSELPNPKPASSQNTSSYRFQDEEMKGKVQSLMDKIAEMKAGSDSTKKDNTLQKRQNESLGIEMRQITQFPKSVHRQFLKEMTQKNVPFVIRRYESVAWCEKVRRAVLRGEKDKGVQHESGEDSAATQQQGGMVTVAVTPNGRADAIFEENHDECGTQQHTGTKYFLYPEEKHMPVEELLKNLELQSDFVSNREGSSINDSSSLLTHNSDTNFTSPCNFFYVQTQNDNLRKDFPHLLEHVDEDLELGEYCFEDVPEAMNLWMGTDGTTSSLHRDFYENLYIVAEGVKEFLLYPPFMQPYLYEQSFDTGEWKEVAPQQWKIVKREEQNVWCAVDPEHPAKTVREYPWFAKATPFRVEVGPGDLLYLPSTWFHQVSQRSLGPSKLVVAVNYWYPMLFESRFHYNQMIEKMGELIQTGEVKAEI